MIFEPFDVKFPKIAEKLTRSAFLYKETPEQPSLYFTFQPAFCNEIECDCRRAMIFVFSSDPNLKNPLVAVLSYGWEPKSYYLKWFPGFPEKELKWFKGPAVEPYHHQTKFSETVLGIFKDMLKDPDYAKRFITQYALLKWKLGMKLPKDLKPYLKMMEPCPCGSGKILKVCCAAG